MLSTGTVVPSFLLLLLTGDVVPGPVSCFFLFRFRDLFLDAGCVGMKSVPTYCVVFLTNKSDSHYAR